MELTRDQVNHTKGIAILFMLFLHLFCTKTYQGVFTPIIMIGEVPLVYYIALFGDCCVPIYCFCSGYGLFLSYHKDEKNYTKNNRKRILRLYINFWVVLFLFVVLLGPMMGRSAQYPGKWSDFLLTFTGINAAYNGAWWFFTTYILLTVTSSFIHKIVKRHNAVIIIVISFIIYFLAYIQRIKGVIVIDNEIAQWGIKQFALWGTTQFAFVIGALFAYHRYYSKVVKLTEKIKWKNLCGLIIITAMIVGHGFIQSMFIAPFIGVIFIIVFNIMNHAIWLKRALGFISIHSTNMWLIHMFFYMIYFREIVFAPKYPVFIFIWLVVLCIGTSYLINYFIRVLDMKLLYRKSEELTVQ